MNTGESQITQGITFEAVYAESTNRFQLIVAQVPRHFCKQRQSVSFYAKKCELKAGKHVLQKQNKNNIKPVVVVCRIIYEHFLCKKYTVFVFIVHII